MRTARRTVTIGRSAGAHELQAFLLALRKAYRRAGTIWLLADRASGHTAAATLALAKDLRIGFVWLPRQWPELNAMDQLWKELKRDVAANRQDVPALINRHRKRRHFENGKRPASFYRAVAPRRTWEHREHPEHERLLRAVGR